MLMDASQSDPGYFHQMDVMVDLRLSRSSADWVNNAGSRLWM